MVVLSAIAQNQNTTAFGRVRLSVSGASKLLRRAGRRSAAALDRFW